MSHLNSGMTFVVVILFTTTAAATDSVPLLNIDPATQGTFVEPANNRTWGYSFYVTSPIRVTYLAWNDTAGDGLSHAHPVGIWKDTSGIAMSQWSANPFPNGGALVASTTIPAGTAAELSGPWRRVPIAPVVLDVGGYSIGGQNNSASTDDMVYELFGFPAPHPPGLDPRVLSGSFTFNIDGDDGFYPPGTHNSHWYLINGAELGAMMFIDALPEPGAFILFLMGGAAIATMQRKCRYVER